MSDPRFEAETPFTDAEVAEIEKAIGRSLPSDYLDFVMEYGGAFVGGLVDGSGELSILTFFSANGDAGIIAKLSTHIDLKNDGVLPIADCELGNLYVLGNDNAVHYINYYSGEIKTTRVGNSFSEFLAKIVVAEE